MSNLLNSVAVGRQSGENAGEILQAYIQTGPQMTLAHNATPQAAVQQTPNAAGAIDPTRM